MAESKRKGGGSKLARTETVQVRLDPKLRFAAELAAARERRTLSSFIEWALERAIREVAITRNKEGNSLTAAAVANETWDVDEADRFVKLAMAYPELLTHDEQRLWKLISEFDFKFHEETIPTAFSDNRIISAHYKLIIEGEPQYRTIRSLWQALKDYIKGEITIEELNKVVSSTNPSDGIYIQERPADGN